MRCELSLAKYMMVRPLAGLALCLLLVCLIGAGQAVAASRAGSLIVNQAQLRAEIDDQTQIVTSNQASDRVGEVIDVSLSSEAPSPVLLERQTDSQPVALLLHNAGNGSEAFLMSFVAGGRGARIRSLAIDTNNDGHFDPAIDSIIGANEPTRALAPGETLRLFALVDMSAEGTADFTFKTQSVTGSGEPGTLFAGQGDSGGDALIGSTHAEASLVLAVAAAEPEVSLVKSQQILAADGSSLPVRGATVRYLIEAHASAGAAVANARVVDPVPDGTTYIAGSLKLDGTPLSDAADSDPGLFANNAIEVALDNLSTTEVRTVAFSVKIN
jgi:uncharacterized repeat protein (TIGR01451 family)